MLQNLDIFLTPQKRQTPLKDLLAKIVYKYCYVAWHSELLVGLLIQI